MVVLLVTGRLWAMPSMRSFCCVWCGVCGHQHHGISSQQPQGQQAEQTPDEDLTHVSDDNRACGKFRALQAAIRPRALSTQI